MPYAFSDLRLRPKMILRTRNCAYRSTIIQISERLLKLSTAPLITLFSYSREWRNGRRAGFRCQCPQGCGGSNPPSRTNVKSRDIVHTLSRDFSLFSAGSLQDIVHFFGVMSRDIVHFFHRVLAW